MAGLSVAMFNSSSSGNGQVEPGRRGRPGHLVRIEH